MKNGQIRSALLAGLLCLCGAGSNKESAPTAVQIKEATADVRAPFQKEYADPAGAGDLAATLLAQLPRLKKPAAQYACCAEAYELARKAGDATLALRAVEALDLRFANVDAMTMEMGALAPLAKPPMPPPPPPAVCAALLQRATETYLRALARDDKEGKSVAEKLAPVLRTLAGGTKPPATAALVELLKEGGLFARRRGLGDQAVQRAGATHGDAAANEAAGRWLCFAARKWEEGLAYLGRCENPELKRLALLEAGAADDKARLEVARQWAMLPTKGVMDAVSAANVRAHAREMCGRAALASAGATREEALATMAGMNVLGGVGAAAAAAPADKVHQKRIVDLAFSPDGSTLFSSSIDGVLASWNVASKSAIVRTLPNEAFREARFVPAPDSRHVTINYYRWTAVFTARDLTTALNPLHDIYGECFTKDGSVLIVRRGVEIGAVVMDGTASGAALRILHTAPLPAEGVVLSPDETMIFGWYKDNTVRGFPLRQATDVALWTAQVSGRPHKVRVAPDNNSVWVGGNCKISQMDLRSGVVLSHFDELDAPERNMPDFSADTAWFLGWNRKDNRVELWNTGAKKRVAQVGASNTTWACWLPDSKRFLWTEGLTLKLSDVNQGVELASFDTGQTSIAVIAVSPDGKWVATGSAEGEVRFWPTPPLRGGR